MVHLVTDSTADLSAAEASALGVRMVPLTVRFGEEQFRDGIDITADAFYERLAAGDHAATSQPTPQAFADVYRELLKAPGDSVVSVQISGKLSGTLQSANLAAQEFGGRVTAVDSTVTSSGLVFLLRKAAALAAGGAASAEIVAALEDARSRVDLYVLFDTLVYLQRGGRIGKAQAFLGGALGVKPLLQLRDGEVHPHSRVRNRQKGIKEMLGLIEAAGTLEAVDVIYTTTPDVAQQVRADVATIAPGIDVGVRQAGPVLGTYAGPGTIGIAVLRAQ